MKKWNEVFYDSLTPSLHILSINGQNHLFYETFYRLKPSNNIEGILLDESRFRINRIQRKSSGEPKMLADFLAIDETMTFFTYRETSGAEPFSLLLSY